jgi:hypothetical protein
VGVPLRVPPTKFKPVGSVPVNVTAPYGGVPLVAVIETEYAVPCCPIGKEAGMMPKAGLTMMLKVTTLESCGGVELSVTNAVMLNVPAVVGVPFALTLPLSLKFSQVRVVESVQV